jgi:hypothetical protein
LKIEANNARLHEKLAIYHDLPLNKELAAAKLYEAKMELQQIEEQFNHEIKQML